MKRIVEFVFSQIVLKKFASRLVNNETDSDEELEQISKFLRLDPDETEVPLKQVEEIIH